MKAQFLRFLIAGGTNTLITYAIYVALLSLINPYWSYVTAFMAGIFISYALNLKFTFTAEHSAVKMISYPLVYAAQLVLGISVLHICLKAGVSEKLAPLFAIAASVPITFFLSRWIVSAH